MFANSNSYLYQKTAYKVNGFVDSFLHIAYSYFLFST